MSLMDAIAISRQGLSVQRQRMQVVASNMANISTTETPEGGPYRRRQLVVEAAPLESFANLLGSMEDRPESLNGVRASEITLDPSPFIQKFEPGHPAANAQGYVAYPNINPAIETVDMMNIARSYEANLTAIRSAKEMLQSTIELLRI